MKSPHKAQKVTGVKKRFLRLGTVFVLAISTLSSSLLTPASTQSSAADNTIKIMPLGDSITYGMADEGGYRKYLS